MLCTWVESWEWTQKWGQHTMQTSEKFTELFSSIMFCSGQWHNWTQMWSTFWALRNRVSEWSMRVTLATHALQCRESWGLLTPLQWHSMALYSSSAMCNDIIEHSGSTRDQGEASCLLCNGSLPPDHHLRTRHWCSYNVPFLHVFAHIITFHT